MNYINGEWIESNTSNRLKVINPATKELLKEISFGGKSEAKEAVNVASKAFSKWKKTTGDERASYMEKAADYIKEDLEDIARTMTLEMGKPIKESRGEVQNAADFLDWFAGEARRTFGDVVPASKAKKHLMVLKQPVGVVSAITPWNFPVSMITRKVAPAIAAGCTVVLKPSPESPLSAMKIVDCLHKAGFPEGVVNLVNGDAKEVGEEFTSNPIVKKITFTGSTNVGKYLLRASSDTVKKVSLELGGNAPFIVFEDADIDKAVSGALRTKFRNCGQTCVNTNRIYVHDNIMDEFSKKYTEATKAMKIGEGLDENNTISPLISEAAIEKVHAQVEDAVEKGASVLTGGKRASVGNLDGYFYEPTVLKDVNASMKITNEETFGPIAPLYSFRTDEEVLEFANNTTYGLASYFYTQDVKRIYSFLEELEYGIVGINDPSPVVVQGPFGGVKESGIGSEGGIQGIEEFLEEKFVSLNLE